MTTLGIWLFLVALRLDGQLLAPSLLAVSADGTVNQLDFQRPQMPADTDHLWLWAHGRAPLRVQPAELALAQGRLLAQRRQAFPVALQLSGKKGAAGVQETTGMLLAAPVAMWLEVPEHLLPRLDVSTVRENAVVAAHPEAWRFRFVGPDCGSFWHDAVLGSAGNARRVVLEVWPAEDRQIEVLRADGSYVDGAAIELGPRYGSPQKTPYWAFYTTSPEGLAGVPGLPSLEPLTLGVHSPDLVSAWAAGSWSALPRRYVLQAGGTIAGRVLAGGVPTRTPATVEAEWWAAEGRATVERIHRETRDGLFLLDGIPPGRVALEIGLTGYAGASLKVQMEAGGRIDLGDVELKPGGALDVRVLRQADDEPIEAASVSCSWGRDAKPMETDTDARGGARCEGVAAGEAVSVRAYRQGYVVGGAEGVYAGARTPVEIRLRRAFVVHGRFLDAGDRVPVNPTCRLEQGNRTATCFVEADGAFQVEPETGQAFAIALGSATTAELELPQKAGFEGEARDLGVLRGPAGVTIVGRVEDESGQPLPGARVWALRAAARTMALALEEGDRAETRSGAAGRFALSGVAGRQVELRIEALGYAPGLFPIAVPDDDELVEAGALELSAGATVEVVLSEAPVAPASAVLDLHGSGRRADRRESGVEAATAVFEHVPPGRHRLAIYDPQLLCRREVAVEDQRKVRVECAGARAVVRGKATRGGGVRPATGRLYFGLPPAKGPVVILNSGTPSGLFKQEVLGADNVPPVAVPLAANGEFETDQLVPGSWTVSWIAENGERSLPLEVLVPEGDAPSLALDFEDFGPESPAPGAAPGPRGKT